MSTTPKAQILDIVGLVEYQDGAVVSRQLLKTESGNLTLFAFDQDQELSEHTTPYDALVQVLDGEAEFRIAREIFHLEAGQAIILPADQPHAVRATRRFKMLLSMLHA